MLSNTRVVNVRVTQRYDIFIGRPSKWGNPFKVGRDGSRSEVLDQFLNYICSRDDLRAATRAELRSKTLGCFCAPLPCHGDILADIADSRPRTIRRALAAQKEESAE